MVRMVISGENGEFGVQNAVKCMANVVLSVVFWWLEILEIYGVIGLGLPGSPQVYRFFMASLSKLYVE